MTKTYTHYEKLTPEEAEKMTIAEARKVCVRNSDHGAWKNRTLCGVHCGAPEFPFVTFCGSGTVNWKQCARAIEAHPRDVPEGCTPLPEDMPWLAFLPSDLVNECEEDHEDVFFCSEIRPNGWNGGSYNLKGGGYISIDVRTDFAKEHFPQIVEAMEYEDKPCEDDAFEEYYKTSEFKKYSIGMITDHKQTWDAAIAWKEGQK